MAGENAREIEENIDISNVRGLPVIPETDGRQNTLRQESAVSAAETSSILRIL